MGLIAGSVLEAIGKTPLMRLRRIGPETGARGISSGTNTWAAVEIAKRLGPDSTVVTVLADTGERYLSTELFCQETAGPCAKNESGMAR